MSTTKQTMGRPQGSKNIKGRKAKADSKSSIGYAEQYMSLTGGAPGSGNILTLLDLLRDSVQKHWTDQRIRSELSGKGTAAMDNIENACHFFASSKGRLICSNNDLPACKLFPGVALTGDFLDHYIHSFDDVLTYGDFVTETRNFLQNKIRELA